MVKLAGRIAEDATDLADTHLQKVLRNGSTKVTAYILQHEAPLRRLAERNKRFNFLIAVIDWLKVNAK